MVGQQAVRLQRLHQLADLLVRHRLVAHLPGPAVEHQDGDRAVVGQQLGELRLDVVHLRARDWPAATPCGGVPDRVVEAGRRPRAERVDVLAHDVALAVAPGDVRTLKLPASLGHSAKPSWCRVVSTPYFIFAATAASAHWPGSRLVGLNSLMSRFGFDHEPVYVRMPKWMNMPKRRSTSCAEAASSELAGVPPPAACRRPPPPPAPPPRAPGRAGDAARARAAASSGRAARPRAAAPTGAARRSGAARAAAAAARAAAPARAAAGAARACRPGAAGRPRAAALPAGRLPPVAPPPVPAVPAPPLPPARRRPGRAAPARVPDAAVPPVPVAPPSPPQPATIRQQEHARHQLAGGDMPRLTRSRPW